MSEGFIDSRERKSLVEVDTLPQEYAHLYAHNALATDRIIDVYLTRKILRQFSRPTPIPEIPNLTLCLDYGAPLIEQSGVEPDLRFKYVMTDPTGQEVLVAEMRLEQNGPHEFILRHRLVQKAFRDIPGLGSRLLAQAHDFVRQVAEERGHAIRVTAYVGQIQVAKWLTKPAHGYTVLPYQESLWQEVEEHPERFNRDEEERAGKDRVFYIQRKEPTGDDRNDILRFTFTKLIQPGN